MSRYIKRILLILLLFIPAFLKHIHPVLEPYPGFSFPSGGETEKAHEDYIVSKDIHLYVIDQQDREFLVDYNQLLADKFIASRGRLIENGFGLVDKKKEIEFQIGKFYIKLDVTTKHNDKVKREGVAWFNSRIENIEPTIVLPLKKFVIKYYQNFISTKNASIKKSTLKKIEIIDLDWE